ncbi:MAG: hypothetical protein BWY98_00722 [Tenericutes bacterium ADurb.BinA155]|nr:MAG: hypothetical protein BWY98_00722 [Tenericutes bacterium ADurb.BinA155]
MIGKRKILLPILTSLLSFGILSGCGTSANSNSALVTTSSTTSQTTSEPPIVEEELDLTAPALSHPAVTASDEEVLKITKLVKEDITAVSQIPSSTVSIVKNLIVKSYLTSAQIDLLLAAATDLKGGFLASSYAAASTSFTAFFPRLETALNAIDGDQIGYLLQEVVSLLQTDTSKGQIPSGLIFGLKTSEDYQGAMNAFSASFPGFKTQFDQYATYFDGLHPYQEGIEEGKVALTTSLSLALGRALRALLLNAIKVFSNEEKVLALASLALSIANEDLAYGQEVKDKQEALKANPLSIINHLGTWVLSFKITKGSWTAIHDHAAWLIKAYVTAKKGVFFRAKAINTTYYDSLLNFIESKKDVVTGAMLAVTIKLVGTLATKFSQADLEAINKAQGATPVNPISQLIALYDRSYATLSAAEKATLSALFTNLGLSYETVYNAIVSWSALDLSKSESKKTISDYLHSLATTVVNVFTPTLAKPDVTVYLKDPIIRRGSVLMPKAFGIDTGSQGNPVPEFSPDFAPLTFTISNVVAPANELGFHRGTFTLTSSAGDSYAYEFGYDVIETFAGIDPDFYPNVSSPHGEASAQSRVLYLQEGISLEQLKTYNVPNIPFFEDDRTIHTPAFSDPALTLTLSSSAVGNAYLLLTYRVSSSLTLYGVMKVKIFASSEVYYSTLNQTNYVVQNGDSYISVYKMVKGVNDDEVTLAYLYPAISTLGISPDALGLKTYSGHGYGTTFDVRLNVVDPSACVVESIVEFMPYLKTTYHVGEAFSLAALKLLYSYVDSGGSKHSAGMGFVQNPQVSTEGFQTAVPVASAMATVHYLTFNFTFAYTVIA